mmetsp:Transcript_5176/g.12534  ORF Transcript_5176/g.12534 Transcript_5176/m.12534 type:complete len:199 (-) Transcript_5176:40-636(-)
MSSSSVVKEACVRVLRSRAWLAGAAAAVAFASATAVHGEEGAAKTVFTEGRRAGGRPQWAYPSPYDAGEGQPSARFLDRDHFARSVRQWNLSALLRAWEASDSDETWPWVWTWRNKNGPHYVFVGVAEMTLDLARELASRSERNNLTVVVGSIQGLGPGLLGDLHAARCAVIESQPEQIDFQEKILMLKDERIICYLS